MGFVGLGEGVAALFAHPLNLSDFSDGFLELFHPGRELVSLERRKQSEKDKHTVVGNPGCCIFGSLGCGGMFEDSTCVWNYGQLARFIVLRE